MSKSASVIWSCDESLSQQTNMSAFRKHVNREFGLDLKNYTELHAWSVSNAGEFWQQIWAYCNVQGEPGGTPFDAAETMLDSKFFPTARLNFAQNLLQYASEFQDDDALVFWAEDRLKTRLSWNDLEANVSRFAQALRSLGVVSGDRVAAFMPNIPETIVGMLAASSIGAIWSSCSPDFGVQGVLDRFGQVEPKVLLATDGYFYAGKEIDNLEKVASIAEQIPSLERVVICPYFRAALGVESTIGSVKSAQLYADFVGPFTKQPIEYTQLPFDHPLYILFSSGTTGAPKCIVHGAGGTLLQHLKEHQLHNDTKPQDRIFYFTTCTWMMWNWLVSGLASGATLLLFDGSPFHPGPTVLFDYADAEGMTHFGTSAKYIDALKNEKLVPADSHSLASVRVMNSTGSPLIAENFDYVYDCIKHDVYLASISGGTDIISCFVLGDPSSDLHRGEIACKGLGMAVEVWDDNAKPIDAEKGELVCTQAFPSMPIYFWNDPQDEKYQAAYFERYGTVWAQGDFAEVTDNGGLIIYGRSDATLNPGGVRIGTAEIYRQVETMDEVLEAVVIGQNFADDVRVVLFLVMNQGHSLDDELRAQIRKKIRAGASPRHVPAVILQVADIPRTKSGKISELAVRDVVEARAVKNTTALANPEALDNFSNLAELST